jgi:hypothetical protein
MILSTFLIATLLAAPPLQGRTAPPVHAQTSSETAEGVEILRRILIEALDKAFAKAPEHEKALLFDQGAHVNGLVTRLWAGGQTVQHARAFHMPGAGLFFALDLSLPVVRKDPGVATTDEPEDDEWERARRDLRGTFGPEGLALQRIQVRSEEAGEIDPKAIDQATDLVLRSLARHLGRIEGLSPNEVVTVALRLSGDGRNWFHGLSEDEPTEYDDRRPAQHDEAKKSRSMAYSAFILSTGAEVREQNLVLQIAVADLLRSDSATSEELRRAARLNRY